MSFLRGLVRVFAANTSRRLITGCIATILVATGVITADQVQWHLLQTNLTGGEIINWQFEEFQSFTIPPLEGAYYWPLDGE